MKKSLLLFIAALCATVAVKAETITLEPGENKIEAVIPSLSDGDVIELQAGTYTEWHPLTFTTEVTVKATEGATPVVKINKWFIKSDFEANGIEFTNLGTDYMLRTGGDVAGIITVKNCTMSNEGASPFIYLSSNSVGSLVIDNCIFKDNAKTQGAVVTAESSPITNFTMTNTTIYNCGSTGDLEVYLAKCENALVDHCTFYNCAKRPLYINGSSLISCVVKNCVISSSTATGNYCIATYAGTVDNCVYYNTSAPRGEGANVTNCANADPQFVAPDNGNFNFAFTSPLFLATTDGTNIGDPRWGVEAEDAIDIPETLPLDAAVLNGTKISKTAEAISWSENDTKSFASFVINATKSGKYNVVLTETTSSGHNYKVSVIDIDGNILSVAEGQDTWKSGALTLGQITIPEKGNYLVRLENLTSYSASSISAIKFDYAGGAVVDVPGTLPNEDAILSEKAFIDNDTIIFAPRGAEGYTPDGWAKWNVTLEDDALCSFKANCHKFSGNTMKIKISVINSENDTIYQKEENVENNGDSEVALDSIMLAAGDYVIQMQNTVKNSKGRLMSVVVDFVITDDSDIDFSAYTGRTVNVQLIRTFKANMYNPLCLPFAVSDELFQQIFKSTKSFILSEASLENQKLFVKLAENYGIYQGTPVMVKPSEDVVNPIFENVEIITANPSSTTNGPLCLRGSFARHELENKENILLVGANNTLFFPSDEHPYIKSMRAYFELKDVEPSQMPRFAAFVEPGNAPTEMIIVGGEAERQKGHRKVLVDGQIRIQHEGKCYSILGLER